MTCERCNTWIPLPDHLNKAWLKIVCLRCSEGNDAAAIERAKATMSEPRSMLAQRSRELAKARKANG